MPRPKTIRNSTVSVDGYDLDVRCFAWYNVIRSPSNVHVDTWLPPSIDSPVREYIVDCTICFIPVHDGPNLCWFWDAEKCLWNKATDRRPNPRQSELCLSAYKEPRWVTFTNALRRRRSWEAMMKVKTDPRLDDMVPIVWMDDRDFIASDDESSVVDRSDSDEPVHTSSRQEPPVNSIRYGRRGVTVMPVAVQESPGVYKLAVLKALPRYMGRGLPYPVYQYDNNYINHPEKHRPRRVSLGQLRYKSTMAVQGTSMRFTDFNNVVGIRSVPHISLNSSMFVHVFVSLSTRLSVMEIGPSY
ncbi:hypothetical protein CALCODRAFT_505918 [Calocera cornea HHB12733]|uniref:Uncharacterized protein n=1 Tax=Calocera cornea HHB12733 TaxID=1353952 RepID=A0A165JGR0_9BASI|nr:hypothetical protein CALCODRAFT_505918 [Calocera cornea HHB12733]